MFQGICEQKNTQIDTFVISSLIQTLTVGFGISPNPDLKTSLRLRSCAFTLADFTADREFHPAPKIKILNSVK